MIKVNKPKIRLNEFENIWTKSRLGELYEVYSGNTPSRSDSRNYQNGEIPWIKTTDLNNSLLKKTAMSDFIILEAIALFVVVFQRRTFLSPRKEEILPLAFS